MNDRPRSAVQLARQLVERARKAIADLREFGDPDFRGYASAIEDTLFSCLSTWPELAHEGELQRLRKKYEAEKRDFIRRHFEEPPP